MSAPTSFDTRLTALLTIASLTLWFAIGFPWQQHNESLVWVIEMEKIPFLATLLSNPITPVQTYRPLGVALAWLGLRATDGGIWLQQLINFAVTAAAWLLALRACRERLAFSWLSFVVNGGLFSGYIYLFHLHGVFYGPLFLFLAWLLVEDCKAPPLTGPMALRLFAIAVIAALFHTFALLFFAAWMAGYWLQNRLQRRPASLAAALLTIVFAAVFTRLLVSHSNDLGQGNPWLGLVVSYRALELKPVLSLLSVALAAIAALAAPLTMRLRLSFAALAVLAGAALMVLQLPAIFIWIVICGLRAIGSGRWALAGLIAVTGLLPVATATGSPTYALFVLMPCIVATVDGLRLPVSLGAWLHRLGYAVLLAVPLLVVAARLGVPLPVFTRLAEPLQAEREKTGQLQAVFHWLDNARNLSGQLALCQPGDFPTHSENEAIERRYRAPTHAWPFGRYLAARYGTRLSQADGPQLRLCFGGEALPGAETLLTIPGTIAGDAVLYRLPAPA